MGGAATNRCGGGELQTVAKEGHWDTGGEAGNRMLGRRLIRDSWFGQLYSLGDPHLESSLYGSIHEASTPPGILVTSK